MNIIAAVIFVVVFYTVIGAILAAACGDHHLVFQWPIAIFHHYNKDCNRAWNKTLSSGRFGPAKLECPECLCKFSEWASKEFRQCPKCNHRGGFTISDSQWRPTDEFPLNTN